MTVLRALMAVLFRKRKIMCFSIGCFRRVNFITLIKSDVIGYVRIEIRRQRHLFISLHITELNYFLKKDNDINSKNDICYYRQFRSSILEAVNFIFNNLDSK